jgi:alpha-glucosidase
VPLPWSGTHPPFGFTGVDVKPWLPQPPEWRAFTPDAQAGRADTMLSFYRSALDIRRAHVAGRDEPLTWLEAPDGVLAFDRGSSLSCAVNLSAAPYRLSGDVLVASDAIADDELPTDAAAWFRRDRA